MPVSPARKPCVCGVAQTFVSVFLLPEPILSQLLSDHERGGMGCSDGRREPVWTESQAGPAFERWFGVYCELRGAQNGNLGQYGRQIPTPLTDCG